MRSWDSPRFFLVSKMERPGPRGCAGVSRKPAQRLGSPRSVRRRGKENLRESKSRANSLWTYSNNNQQLPGTTFLCCRTRGRSSTGLASSPRSGRRRGSFVATIPEKLHRLLEDSSSVERFGAPSSTLQRLRLFRLRHRNFY
jgi:hypothetical protein